MFERFTNRARKVMALANQEAQRFKHEYIGTEHILLGLVKDGSGVGATVLKNLDVDIKKLCLEVEKLVKSSPDTVTLGKLPQTPQAKKVIEYAIEEARSLNHNYVGTEHIQLGLLRESEGIAAQVLMNLGLKLEDVRQEVLNLLVTGGYSFGIRIIPITEEILSRMKKVIKASLAYEDAVGVIRKTGITAEVGVILACNHLNLHLCVDPKAEGFDAIDQRGRQFQIKTRRSETEGLPSDLGRLSSFLKHHFDYVVLVMLNPDYSLAEIWRAEYRDALPLIVEKYKRRNPNLSSFKKVSRRIWPLIEKKGEIKMSEKSRRSENIISAEEGLLKDEENEEVINILKKYLKAPEIEYICSLRNQLYNKKINGLTEAFNKNKRYFIYWTGTDNDKAYIYVQKENLRIELDLRRKNEIDLDLRRKYEEEIRNEGFKVKFVNNFQGQDGWLTGWYLPYSTKNINVVIKYLSKALRGKRP